MLVLFHLNIYSKCFMKDHITSVDIFNGLFAIDIKLSLLKIDPLFPPCLFLLTLNKSPPTS